MSAAVYPTWTKVSDLRWESEERVDGVPDFIIEKQTDATGRALSPVCWSLKWRTSEKSTTFTGRDAVAQAKASIP